MSDPRLPPNATTSRPMIVPVAAAFSCMATVLALLIGSSLLISGTLPDRVWNLNPRAHIVFSLHPKAFGSLLLIVALVAAITAVGLLRRRRWAWLLALATFAVNGLGDLVSLLVLRDWLRGGSGVLIAGFFLFLLLRPSVRAYFARPA
jgi:hypothetical protein